MVNRKYEDNPWAERTNVLLKMEDITVTVVPKKASVVSNTIKTMKEVLKEWMDSLKEECHSMNLQQVGRVTFISTPNKSQDVSRFFGREDPEPKFKPVIVDYLDMLAPKKSALTEDETREMEKLILFGRRFGMSRPRIIREVLCLPTGFDLEKQLKADEENSKIEMEVGQLRGCRIICDETNNTPKDIASGHLNVDFNTAMVSECNSANAPRSVDVETAFSQRELEKTFGLSEGFMDAAYSETAPIDPISKNVLPIMSGNTLKEAYDKLLDEAYDQFIKKHEMEPNDRQLRRLMTEWLEHVTFPILYSSFMVKCNEENNTPMRLQQYPNSVTAHVFWKRLCDRNTDIVHRWSRGPEEPQYE